MNIPEEALTAAREAVEAWFDRVNHPALDIICDFEVDSIARAALSAAAPLLMAQALREAARDLSWFGAQGNLVEPNTAWAGVAACMNALNNKANELEQS